MIDLNQPDEQKKRCNTNNSLLKTNRLKDAESPYLLQHAFNPVDWYPWGDEAFERARRENKPVFLSIGYSSCHWCHVMAHESFEDPEVADLLNRYFIPVKVDREERPDVDELYMEFVHALHGRGGWPLSVFLTPDRRPFYGGTYYPKTSRHGMPGFTEVLIAIRQAWDNRKEEILKSANDIVAFLGRPDAADPVSLEFSACTEQAYHQLSHSFDPVYGGFGSAPKFPSPHQLMFLMRYASRTGDERAWFMAERTLQAMRAGGIYDHPGGGFHRYSTDRYWRLPHFEKMLNDQALMALVYTEAWQHRKKDLWKQTAEATLDFVLRDLRSPEGGFYTALDADSPDGEGRYYLWTDQELKNALLPEEYEWVRKNWNIDAGGNFEEESTGRKNGLNILYETLTKDISDDDEERLIRMDQIRKKLFHWRSHRPLPFRDDKILCDGNGLMIAALTKAGVVFRSEQYLQFASDAVNFSVNAFLRPDGSLWRRYRNQQSGIEGVLDDYAMLIFGLIHFYQATARHDVLMLAIRLTEKMIQDFRDKDHGAFFTSPSSSKDIIVRRKTLYDGAHPSGNSVASWNLAMLGRITGNDEWLRMAQETGQVFSSELNRAPYGFTFYLSAAELWSDPANDRIIITGNPDSTEFRECIYYLHQEFDSKRILILRDDRNPDELNRQIPSLQAYPQTKEPLRWYLCGQYACYAYGSSVQELQEELKKK